MTLPELFVGPQSPDSEPARAIVRAYLDEVVGRFHGRSLTPTELDSAVGEFANDDLVSPRGVLMVAWLDDHPVGCAGLRFPEGEVVQVFVEVAHRRNGIAKALMRELASQARTRGIRRLRLDTRHDLAEARAFYASIGFHEVSPFNDGPYAEHWFEQILA